MDTDEAIESVRINGVSLLSLLKGILSPVTKKTLKHGLTVVIQIIPISLILKCLWHWVPKGTPNQV